MKRLLTFFCLLAISTMLPAAEKSNVIIFLIDDLGWRDLGCYGSTFYQTPRIDSLAVTGMKFTDAYSAASLCSPTRAALLSGKHPARLRFTYIISGAGHREVTAASKQTHAMTPPDWTPHLALEETTFAEAFQAGGYATAQFGKWHVGGPDLGPQQQGFEVSEDAIPRENHQDKNTAQLTTAAIDFMRAKKDTPFLIHLCHHAVHTPLQADPQLIADYRAKAPSTGQRHPTMAAMIHMLDAAVGHVLDALHELNLEERTIILFTSDNGGLRNERSALSATDNSPLRAGKATPYEGGSRVPLIIRWPGVTAPGSTSATPVISMDLYPTLLNMAALPAAPQQHLDGLSLAPVLKGGTLPERDLFWHFPHYHAATTPYSAMRSGPWKLIEHLETGTLELFDLRTDLSEKHDLSREIPERTQSLHQRLQTWRQSLSAQMPTPVKKP